jgi:hypothetical protein
VDESPIIVPEGINAEVPEGIVLLGEDFDYPEPSPEGYPWPGDPNEKAVIGSGTLRLRANIGAEAGVGSSSNVKLNGTSQIRDLIGKAASTQTKMSEFYGASATFFDKSQTPAQAGGGYSGYGPSYLRGGSGNATSWAVNVSVAGANFAPDAYIWLWADVGFQPSKTYRVDYDITLSRNGPSGQVYAGVTTKNNAGRGFNWSSSSNWSMSTTEVGRNFGSPYDYYVGWNQGGTMTQTGGGQSSTRHSNYYNISTGSGNNYFCLGIRAIGNANGNAGGASATIHSLVITEI